MRNRLLIILSILFLTTFAFSEYQDEDNQAQYYDNAKVLRVKYAEGETYVRRSYEEGYEEASVNLSIFEKDTVGTTEGRVEIYLGRLNYLRLDDDTEVEIERAPELRRTDMGLRLTRGGIYLDIENIDNERDIEIQTPDCGVFLLGKGLYRVNVTERGRTQVYVYEGLAEVSGEDYSRNVRENQKIVMANGRVTENPFYFYASNADEFDRWNRQRKNAGGYARYGTSRYLANGYEDYEYELSRSGRWVYYNDYREYIWIPYHIGSSWSPYSNGRWTWNPYYGQVWNSYDDWGYFTHHYGRWQWDNYYGWYWYPGYHWSPAWVYWFWDNDYYGWCPVSRWNRPVVIVNNRWLRNHDHHRDGIPVHSRSTVVIRKNQLGSSHIGRAAVDKATLGKINISGKGFSMKEKTSLETVKVVNARGRTVAYKKGGFQETQKYETLKPGLSTPGTGKEIEYKYREKAGKEAERRAFKYSKISKPGDTDSPGAYGREIKIEKKDPTTYPGAAYPGKSYKSDKTDKAEKTDRYREKSTTYPGTPGKTRSPEESKARYKPSEPTESKERKEPRKSDSATSGTSHKVKVKEKEKDKEKHSPGFASSGRYYPSSDPGASSGSSSGNSSSEGSSASYRSTTRYNSYSESHVPSYRSKDSNLSGKSNDSFIPSSRSSRERKSDSSSYRDNYPGFSRSSSSSASSSSSSSSYSSSSPSHSSSRYSSPSGSSSSHSSSHSGLSSSSRSTYSGSSSSGSHGSVAVKKRD